MMSSELVSSSRDVPAEAETTSQGPKVLGSDMPSGHPNGLSSVLSTLNEDGSRRWLLPRPARGRLWNARRWVAWGLIAFFVALPHIHINGKPAILLDLAARRFHILGTTFLPTDTLLLALLLLCVGVAIFLATALLGRVWCGWACPQTVYMEFLYRPLERFFDGEPGRPKKTSGIRGWLQNSPAGKVGKYAAFFLASCFLAHTFLAYFVGVERLSQWVTQSPFAHPGPFLVMAVVTGLMMFDFAFFREQTCLVACPYGRFQSVLLDRHSVIVSYDRERGEPRGKGTKKTVSLPVMAVVGADASSTARRGDCVDCGMCVTTCPTGIDIRNGLQMECVNCTQCIDACDSVMTKLKRPTGLIRYSSQAAMEHKKFSLLRPRTLLYPAILGVLASLFVYFLVTRAPAHIFIKRGMGAPFYTLPTGEIANPVKVHVINNRDEDEEYHVTSLDGKSRIVAETSPVRVGPSQAAVVNATIIVDPDAFHNGMYDAKVMVEDASGYRKERTYRMLGPGKGHQVSGKPTQATVPTKPSQDAKEEIK